MVTRSWFLAAALNKVTPPVTIELNIVYNQASINSKRKNTDDFYAHRYQYSLQHLLQ